MVERELGGKLIRSNIVSHVPDCRELCEIVVQRRCEREIFSRWGLPVYEMSLLYVQKYIYTHVIYSLFSRMKMFLEFVPDKE